MKALRGILKPVLIGLAASLVSLMISKGLKAFAEYGYFEGQKDALNGDVRIIRVDDGVVWSKSPWKSGESPSYQPIGAKK